VIGLPSSWTKASLADLATSPEAISYGVLKPGEYRDDGVPMLRVTDITQNVVVEEGIQRIAPELDAQYQRTRLRGGEIVVSIQGTVGRVAIVPSSLRGANVSRTIAVVPLREPKMARWIRAALMSPQGQQLMAAETGGTTRASLNLSELRRIEIPVPPLAEQERIANKLEGLLARVGSCRDRLDRVPGLLGRFRRSVLAAAVSGQLNERRGEGSLRTRTLHLDDDEMSIPAGWKDRSLSDLIDPDRPLCYGVVQPGDEVSGGIPLIRVQDLENGTVQQSTLRTISKKIDHEFRRSRARPNDVLVSVVGTIGRIAIVPQGLEANIARAIARVACGPEVQPGWMMIWLSCDVLQWWLLRNAREVARKTLNLSELATARVAVPSVGEQREIVAKANALFSRLHVLEKQLEVCQRGVERLPKTLLARAFKGEFVAQDPSDEPAEKLLARLRAGGVHNVVKTKLPGTQITVRSRMRYAPNTVEKAMSRKRRQTSTRGLKDLPDVKAKPYLLERLRDLGGLAGVEDLFKSSELPVADFYKQLAWEVEQGFIRDKRTELEASDAP
jgi:type I restriction enzyme, S subunit